MRRQDPLAWHDVGAGVRVDQHLTRQREDAEATDDRHALMPVALDLVREKMPTVLLRQRRADRLSLRV